MLNNPQSLIFSERVRAVDLDGVRNMPAITLKVSNRQNEVPKTKEAAVLIGIKDRRTWREP
jgi:hypothetical protein